MATAMDEDDDAVPEADLADPNPDVEDLFRHYDGLYFRGALAAAGFTVQWGSSASSKSSLSRSFGSCTCSEQQNTITLSESFLKYCSCTDRKNALLHEMIHAILYVKRQRKDHWNHGPDFRAWMEAINSCCAQDHQRPDGGYNITTRHDFIPEEPNSFKGIVWKCRSCGDTLLRAKNQGPPSDACCIENDDIDASCGNMLCYWHNHKSDCPGIYNKTMLKSEAPSQKKVAGGAQLLLAFPSEMSKSKGVIEESSSSILQLSWSTKATEPNAEDKHLCLGSGSNGKPQGSSSSKKADMRRSPEMVGKTSVLPAQPQGKPNQNHGLVATVKQAPVSVKGYNDAKSPGRDTSKKSGKRHKPDDLQKTSVLPSAPQGTPKLKHALAATENDKLSSAGHCNDAKSRKTNASKKAGEWHELQIAQKACSQPTKQDLIAPEKKELPPLMGSSNEKLLDKSSSKKAYMQHEDKPADLQKTSVLPSTPQGTPKLKHALGATENNKLSTAEHCNDAKSQTINTSKKAGEWHELQIAQKACSQPANPHKRLKQDLIAPEKKELPPLMGSSNEKLLDRSSSKKAYSQHEDSQEMIVLPTASGIKPMASVFVASQKQQKGATPLMGSSNEKLLDRSSSKKAYRQHEPEGIQEATVLPTAPGMKPMASVFVASEKQQKGKRKRKPVKEKERKPVKEKEYAVMIPWLNYYESDRSSGSPEPLVNKRTERRRREKEREKMLAYSPSKKIRTEASVNFGTYASVISTHKIEMVAQDGSMQQSRPPSPCSAHAVVTTADQVVGTPATGDQSQPSAPCLNSVPFLQPADPLTSPDQSTAPDIIELSDDD